jgi:hypothetical protein
VAIFLIVSVKEYKDYHKASCGQKECCIISSRTAGSKSTPWLSQLVRLSPDPVLSVSLRVWRIFRISFCCEIISVFV